VSSLAYGPRTEKIKKLVSEKGLDAIVIEDASTVFYFTGYRGAGLVLATSERVVLAVPVLEYRHAMDYLSDSGMSSYIDLVVFRPYGLPSSLVAEEEGVKLVDGGVAGLLSSITEGPEPGCGFVSNSLRLYDKLMKKCGRLVNLEDEITRMRMVKEAWELERIRQAARIAEAALQEALNSLDYGVSEAELAGAIESAIRIHGGDGPSFPPIVAFGANTVYPHAFPSRSRVLTKPAPVLIDLGAVYRGYCSDMTRTLFFDGSPAEFRHIAEAVHEAMMAALDKAKPGVTTGELDAAARSVLEKYGLAKYFIHSLGHGVGVEIHEPPRVTYSDKTVLEPGMVITIEPGVYIPGKLGVRIEELVAITSTGAERLTMFETWLWR